VRAAAERRGRRAELLDTGAPGVRFVDWELADRPLVSIVVPTAYAAGLLDRLLASVRESTYREVEVIIVDSSGGRMPDPATLLDGLAHRVVPYRGRFGYSRACNLGAAAAGGERLLFVNDDTEVRTPDWIEQMLKQLAQPKVAAAGALLLFPDRRVQHAGVNVAPHGIGANHMFTGLDGDDFGYRGLLRAVRDCSAVTAACMMVDARAFTDLGGFDQGYEMEYGDTDLCLRLGEAGRRVVWTPRAVLTHHEQASGGPRQQRGDVLRFAARWRERFADGDPLYNPGFSAVWTYEYRAEDERLTLPPEAGPSNTVDR
jgi:GT2 family glycosyltransferase